MSKKFCAVAACKNNSVSDRTLSWHRFPKSDVNLRNEWIRRCGRTGPITLSSSRICSAHFAPEALERSFREKLMGTPARRYLKPNALPTLHLEPDDDCDETIKPVTRKRKRPSASDDQAEFTPARSAKIIAKSKRTRKIDGQTEEIVIEVDDEDNNQKDNDLPEDEDNDVCVEEHSKINGRKPEKGVFECTVLLTDDEEDITSHKNEITIYAEPSQMHDDNPIAGFGSVINGHEQNCSWAISIVNGKILDRKPKNGLTLGYDAEASSQNKFHEFEQKHRAEEVSGLGGEKPLDKPEMVKADIIEKLFTPNQLKALMKPKKRIRWTDDEIFEAIKLRFFSLSMYSYLRNKKGYPFPGRLAISRWAKKMKLRGGTLHSVLKILELGGQSSVSAGKYGLKDFCVLSLGDLKVEQTIEYDEIADEIIGPFRKMQVMMASSLTGSWQQPVFVDFDFEITKDTVINVIGELYRIGYYVVCFSSDCSDVSAKLWTDLGATVGTPWFPHPAAEGRVVVMPDALHAVRLTRDYLLDGGFEIEGTAINRMPLDALLDSAVCSKLRPYHLQPNDIEKRRTDPAVQLVSNAVGTALTQYKPGDAEVATSTGNFLKVMSHWFDLMNVGTSELTVPFCSPYGHRRQDQDRLLDHVKSMMSVMKSGQNSSQLPFQKGIIMSCNGLPLLLDETKKLLNSEYITTRRLNHTCMDNLFSLLSYDFSQIPTPVLALKRLQLTLFDANVDTPSENHSGFSFVAKRSRLKLDVDKPCMFDSLILNLLDTIFLKNESEYITGNNCSLKCLSLIAERIISSVGHRYPQLRKHDSESNEPTAYFLGNLVKMEKVFVDFTNGLIAAECKNIVAHLTRLMRKLPNSLPVEVTKIFARLRTEIYAQSLVPKLPELVMKRMLHSKLLSALRESVDEQQTRTE